MSRYAFFLGCMIPYRLPFMEMAARKVLEKLGVELVSMKDVGCCPDPVGIKSLDYKTWLALAARNLSIAEEMESNIMTLCNGCFETLKTANFVLKNDKELREEVNEVLSQLGKEFKGEIEVKHLIEILHDEIGVDKIRVFVEKPLKDLRVAVHYGCHVVRPSDVLAFDDPETPSSLDRLVNVTGAESVPYMRKMLCCGGGIRSIDTTSALGITKRKLLEIQRVNADCIAVICPFCFIQYDIGQTQIRSIFGDNFDIPVLYYPEMLGLAMGIPDMESGLRFHRVKVKPLLEKLNLSSKDQK